MPKPPLFIVEGCDATGKSTLAKHLAQKLGAAYFHSSARGALKVVQYDYLHNILDSVEQTLIGSNLPVVLDRHWPSELCYAPVMRPPGRPILADGVTALRQAPVMVNDMYARLHKLGAEYIFCLTDKGLENHVEHIDKDHPYSNIQYIQIYQNYTTLFRKFIVDKVPCHLYDMAQWDKNVEGFITKLLHETSKA